MCAEYLFRDNVVDFAAAEAKLVPLSDADHRGELEALYARLGHRQFRANR